MIAWQRKTCIRQKDKQMTNICRQKNRMTTTGFGKSGVQETSDGMK